MYNHHLPKTLCEVVYLLSKQLMDSHRNISSAVDERTLHQQTLFFCFLNKWGRRCIGLSY